MSNVGNSMQWLQFIVMVVGLISILIKIGSTQGKQDEKNKNVEENLKSQWKKIDSMETDISTIKSDVAFIKGKLL